MRHIQRLPKPNILVEKEAEWTSKFVASDRKRPDNNKYAHKDIRNQLDSMSAHKCFYCESKLKGVSKEIDHYIEVSEKRDLAYEWTNLYLSCDNCNNKIPNKAIPVGEVLNPCLHTDAEIEAHLFFEKGEISAHSILGFTTIKKFRLNTENLDLLRIKQLNNFMDILVQIQKNQIKEKRNEMTQDEIQSLKRFAQLDYSFSLMFRLLLKKYHIL